MNNEMMMEFEVWGRVLPIKISYDCFEGEQITIVQKETYDQFICNKEQIFGEAFNKIKDYCMTEYSEQITDNFENIFRYVKPKDVYIKRSVTGKRIAGLLCNFKFDMEHGLAAYIEDGHVTKIGPQDIIL